MKFGHKSWNQNGGYKPYKEFFYKISEAAKVNHFNILVDLCHKISEQIFCGTSSICVWNSDHLPGTKFEAKYLTLCNAAFVRNREKVSNFSPRPL
jgi:hypothetical protein